MPAMRKRLRDVVTKYLEAERELYEVIAALRFDPDLNVSRAAWSLWGSLTAVDLRPLLKYLLEAAGEPLDSL